MATRRLLVALAASLLLAIAPASFADSHARIVRLSDIEGDVQIDRNTGHGFEKAIMNMPITHGVRLETGSNGRAEVEFENGSAMRLSPTTSVEFTDLSLRDDGQRFSDVRVNDGTVYVNYKHKGGDELRLNAGNQAITPSKDSHFRLKMADGQAEIAVFKGELEVPTSGGLAKVKKNETFNLDLNNLDHSMLAKGITGFGDDEWDAERSEYNNQYASSFNRSHYPYEYGYSDLSYYGSYFDAPGYGMLWRPFGMSAMWDPFGNGAWAYYPSYGYMWVSSYPWGWMPYRYGRWVYVPTYGWAWQPGGWNTWNSYPVVVNAPPTWNAPVPPAATGGGSTVIVGNPVMGRPPRPGRPAMPSMGGSNSYATSGGGSPTGSTVARPMRGSVPAATTTATPGVTASPAATANPSRPSRAIAPSPTPNVQPQTGKSTTPSAPARPSMQPAPPSAPKSSAPSAAPSRPVTPHSSGMPSGMHSMGSMGAPHASAAPSRPSSPRH